MADINEEKARETAQQSTKYAADPTYHSFGVHVDVVDEESVQQMVETAVTRLGGRIDYFVNCAGVCVPISILGTLLTRSKAANMSGHPVSNLNMKHFDHVMRVNLYGTVNCMKAVSAAMKSQESTSSIPSTRRTSRHPERAADRGCIVNIGSVNSIMANPGNMSYVTSKHAILAATKVAALDLAVKNIRVNVVLPGGTDTPMLSSTSERFPGFRQDLLARTPLKRLASTSEIADTIIYICSPAASYVTGSTVVVDGGLTARL